MMAFGLGGAPQLAPGNPGGRAPIQNPLAALITALGQLPQLRQQQQQQQIATKQAQLSMETQAAQLDAQKRANAQQAIETMKPALIRNSQYASDPQVKTRLQQYYDALGIPMPLDSQGNIDINALKIQPGDPRYAQVIDYGMALPAGQTRKAYFDAQQVYYTPEMLGTKAAISPKDQAAIDRAKTLGVHDSKLDQAAEHRVEIQQQLADARMNMDQFTIQKIQAGIQNSTRDSMTRLQEANTRQYQAQIAGQRLAQSIQQFNVSSSTRTQALVQQNARAVIQEGEKVDSQINQMHQQIIQATNNGESSDIIDALNKRLKSLQDVHDGMQTSLAQAQEIQAQNLGAAGDVQRQSGAKNVRVTNVGSQIGAKGAGVPGEPGYTFTGEKRGNVYVVRGPNGEQQGWTP